LDPFREQRVVEAESRVADADSHYFEKLDPDPHKIEKLDPDQDPHLCENS
jgi:hypothetical protein